MSTTRGWMSMPQSGQRGFTIMELVIVVAIISILAAIAVPSYRQYVMRTNRTIAKVALTDLITRQESYAADHKRYASSFERLGIAGSGTTGYVTTDGVISRNSANALYALHLNSDTTGTLSTCAGLGSDGTPGVNSYRLSATPVSAATDTLCGTLCLSTDGSRGAALGSVETCWRRS